MLGLKLIHVSKRGHWTTDNQVRLWPFGVPKSQLTHCPLIMHTCLSELGQHWFREWLTPVLLQWRHSEQDGISNHRRLELLAQVFVQAQIKENFEAPHRWHLWGKSTGDRWIPLTKGQWHGKCSHLMKSSCWHQADSWANADVWSIGPSGTNFHENYIKIWRLSWKKMHFEMLSQP